MSNPRKHPVDRADVRLFRDAVADVIPLHHRKRVEHDRVLPRPVPEQRLLDERSALDESLSDRLPWDTGIESGEELCYSREGIGPQTLRKLRRGYWVIQAQLDLHGLTSVQARALLGEFLNECSRRGQRCVRIIHGKGLRSKNREPVLKRRVAGWLIRRDQVLAFCQARPADGGSGAVVVLLRSKS